MVVGLPILANTAAFGAVVGLDRVLILALLPDGERAAGLYTVALMGTGWSLDVAGRVVTVLTTHFQATLGRTGDPREVAAMAARAAEAQAPLLMIGGAIAYVFAPAFLGAIMPRYAEGTSAIRPLMPGMVLLGMAWPARQMLIATSRPYRLCLATLAGLAFLAECGAIGAGRGGLIGVAAGMSIGYAGVFLLTGASAFAPVLGLRQWRSHSLRTLAMGLGFGASALLAAHLPVAPRGASEHLARAAVLSASALPWLAYWGWRMGWSELLAGKIANRSAIVAT